MADIISNQKKRNTLAEGYMYTGGKMYVCNGNGIHSPGCNSLIYVRKEDIFRQTEYGLDLSPEYFYSFICPICGAFTKIDINIFPENYKEYADKVCNDAQKLIKTQR